MSNCFPLIFPVQSYYMHEIFHNIGFNVSYDQACVKRYHTVIKLSLYECVNHVKSMNLETPRE